MKEAWTDSKNKRRFDLIEKKYSSELTQQETAELASLQEEMLANSYSKSPLSYGLRLWKKLLGKDNDRS